MKRPVALAFLLVFRIRSIAWALKFQAEAADPLGKTLSLLGNLANEVTKQGELEATAYKEFYNWCDSTCKEKDFEIIDATKKKTKLEADIEQNSGEIEEAGAKINDLAGRIAEDEAELKEATAIRETEAKNFVATDGELADSVDTLIRAIGILEKAQSKKGASFAQADLSTVSGLLSSIGAVVNAAAFSSADQQKLLALLATSQTADPDDDGASGAPAAAVYGTQGAGIIDALQDLKDKAETQLSELRKSETNTKQNFEMLKQSLEDQIAADNKAMAEEKSLKSQAAESKATTEEHLRDTNKALDDATKTLESTRRDCMQTAADHEASVKGREDEFRVIKEAMAILQSSSAGAVAQTYSFAQTGLTSQSMSGSRVSLATHTEVVNKLKKLAKSYHSAALAQLASRIDATLQYADTAGEDPFEKVKGLITDMIKKLSREAEAEAAEKAFCDEQMRQTEEKKDELEGDIRKLTTKIDEAAATSAQLKEDVRHLQAELATLSKSQNEMDKIRRESHAAYVEAKADLEKGLQGVRSAIGVLNEYYSTESSSASLLQSGDDLGAMMRQPAVPTHTKSSGAGTSIIGLLEVVLSDFAKNLSEIETEESDAADEYDRTTRANAVTKTMKVQDVKYKTQEFISLDKTIKEVSADRETTDSELAAVVEYYAQIKDRCIAKPSTYQERSKRRVAEINGLKDALALLREKTALVQRSKRRAQAHSKPSSFLSRWS